MHIDRLGFPDSTTAPEPVKEQVSIQGVIDRVNLAATTMSVKNPNRTLMLNLGRAIVQLAERLEQSEQANARLRRELEAATAVEAPRIVIP